MRTSRNSVLLLELQMVTILFTMSDFTWFLAGDVKLFALVFLVYFIPSMYSVSIAVGDHAKFNNIIQSKKTRRLLIISLLIICSGIVYNLIYSFDWLISGYADSSSILGLMVAAFIIYLIAMDVTITRETIQKIVSIYSMILVIFIPVFLMVVWYYAQYDIIEINKASYQMEPLHTYLMMLSGIPLLIFFDTSSDYFVFFKRAIFSIVIISIIIFGVLSLIGSSLYSPSAPSIFDSVYDKMEYIFADFHPDNIIAFMATMNIIHYGFILVLTTYGIKNLLVANFEYSENRYRSYEEDLKRYEKIKKRKTLFAFSVVIIIIEYFGYFTGFGEITVATDLAIIGIMLINIILSIISIKMNKKLVTILNSQVLIGISLVGLLSVL